MARNPKDTVAKQVQEANLTLAALRVATKGLLYPSESDKPVRAFWWKSADVGNPADASAALVAHGAVGKGERVQAASLAALFDPVTAEESWFGPEDTERARRFAELEKLLRLADVQAFRIGKGTVVRVYIVGRADNGDWAGIQTEVVET